MRVLLFFILCLSFSVVYCKTSSGSISIKDSRDKGIFHFVDKFAFAPPGDGRLTLHVDSDADPFEVLVFYDDNWSSVYSSNKLSCPDKKRRSLISRSVTTSLTFDKPISYIRKLDRPTFAYVVFVNCQQGAHIEATYELNFTNPGGWWSQYIGANLHGLGQWSLMLAIVSLVLVLLHAYAVFFKWGTSYLHPLIIILTVAIVSFSASLWFFFFFFARLASSGTFVFSLHFIADVFMLVFDLSVMLLLILVAKGWAVSTTVLSGKNKLFVLLLTFGGIEIFLLLLESFAVDPAVHTFAYDNVFGYLSVCLRIVAMFYFLVNLAETRSSESFADKRKLYDRGGLLFVFWFIIAPVIILVGAMMPAYEQEKLVDGSLWFFNLLSLIVISWVLWPSRAQKYFKISTPDLFGLISYDN
ncbi:hypothetical protein GEMRC1_007104 [Eukaryota sp. GEM-RC1]